MTVLARSCALVCAFNKDTFLESHHGEKEMKSWNSSNVWLRPGFHEKNVYKDLE